MQHERGFVNEVILVAVALMEVHEKPRNITVLNDVLLKAAEAPMMPAFLMGR